MSKLYLITGPSGVGKTTVSKALAQKLKKCALLEGDEIYAEVVGGTKPWLEGNHTFLMWKNMCDLCFNYLESGIDVIMNYIITDIDFQYIINRLAKFEIHFIILLADRQTIIERDELRSEDCITHRVDEHLKLFSSSCFLDKFRLITTTLSIDDTVSEIITGKFIYQTSAKDFQVYGLKKEFFDAISSGDKIYEVRLNDEKRKKLSVGDRLVFVIEPERKTYLQKKVANKLYFSSFEELSDNINPKLLGFNDQNSMLKTYHEIYKNFDIEKYGVVAIKLS